MAKNRVWTAISYNLPAQPSNSRVYVWRKLKEIGAVPLRQGVAVLPQSSPMVKELLKLSERIKAMHGEAVMFELSFLDSESEKLMNERLIQLKRNEGEQLIKKAKLLIPELEGENSSAAQKKLNKIIHKYRKLWENEPRRQQESYLHKIWEEFSSETGRAAKLLKNMLRV